MVFFIFNSIFVVNSVSKQWRPDQTPHFAAYGLGLHCLPMSLKKDARLIWVKILGFSSKQQKFLADGVS